MSIGNPPSPGSQSRPALGDVSRARVGRADRIAGDERKAAGTDRVLLQADRVLDGLRRDATAARMLAARDTNHTPPLMGEEEASEVFGYLRRL